MIDVKFDKPVFVSEFGAGALQGNHGSKDARWTEEFQEDLFRETVKMLIKFRSCVVRLPGFLPISARPAA